MDLLNIFSTLRRHKIILLLVLLATAGGCAYVVLGIPPQYETQAQYVLVQPPAGPTEQEIQASPALGKLNSNNPYLRLPNPSIVVDVLAQRVSADNARQALIDQGADRNYVISSTNAIGSGLVIQITGTGTSAAAASTTLQLVTERMKTELRSMQTVNGADDRYLFQALPVSPPSPPLRKVTGTMRSLIAVAAAGLILLFAAISIAEALPSRRLRKIRSVQGQLYRTETRLHEEPPPPPPVPALPVAPLPAAEEKPNGDGDLTIVLPRLRFGGREGPAKHGTSRDGS
jgi:capsular polysaccharide biosynthesis protein